MFTQPRVLSQQPCSIHLDAHLKKRFTVIKSKGQYKPVSVTKVITKIKCGGSPESPWQRQVRQRKTHITIIISSSVCVLADGSFGG
jgi:hypothetical protein